MTEIILRNIAALCELKGITLIDLAKTIGIGDRYFMKPHDDLSVILVAKVADYFQVTVGELCREDFHKTVRAVTLQSQIKKLSDELKEIQND